MPRGRFITFEGGEGAGKSTQIRRLADHLQRRGLSVATTREPGGAPGAEQIRRLLVDGAPGRWDGLTETLLHFAARRDHLRITVWPALEAGTWVLSDRYADSTTAYQGFGHGVAQEVIDTLYGMVAGEFLPDLTLILDVPVDIGLVRAKRRGAAEDRYERMGVDFHQRLRQGFLAIAAAQPERCAVIDAGTDVDAVWAAIAAVVDERLGRPLSA